MPQNVNRYTLNITVMIYVDFTLLHHYTWEVRISCHLSGGGNPCPRKVNFVVLRHIFLNDYKIYINKNMAHMQLWIFCIY
jgi:hypothetical protein